MLPQFSANSGPANNGEGHLKNEKGAQSALMRGPGVETMAVVPLTTMTNVKPAELNSAAQLYRAAQKEAQSTLDVSTQFCGQFR